MNVPIQSATPNVKPSPATNIPSLQLKKLPVAVPPEPPAYSGYPRQSFQGAARPSYKTRAPGPPQIPSTRQNPA